MNGAQKGVLLPEFGSFTGILCNSTRLLWRRGCRPHRGTLLVDHYSRPGPERCLSNIFHKSAECVRGEHFVRTTTTPMKPRGKSSCKQCYSSATSYPYSYSDATSFVGCVARYLLLGSFRRFSTLSTTSPGVRSV